MDDERLKQGKTAFGKDYFEELLERIRFDFVQANGVSGRKSPIFLRSAALTMTRILSLPMIFM